MTALAGRLLAEGPAATQLVEDDTWAVGLDLNPITLSLLPDLARLFDRKPSLAWRFKMLRNLPVGSPVYCETLDALRRDSDLQAVFLVPVHPGQAEKLAEQIDEAGIEPEPCVEGDGRYAEDVQLGLCHDHLVAYDRAAGGE